MAATQGWVKELGYIMVEKSEQILYLGRWIPKENFRVFVYNKSGCQLVNSYDEFKSMVSSGLWEDKPITESCDVIEIQSKRGRPKKVKSHG